MPPPIRRPCARGTSRSAASGLDDSDLVGALGSPPRAAETFRELLRRGPSVLPAVRAGARDPSGAVREGCCRLLDQLLVPEALGELTAMLDDPEPRVRIATPHALACDRCKQDDACRPAEADVLPPALRLLGEARTPTSGPWPSNWPAASRQAPQRRPTPCSVPATTTRHPPSASGPAGTPRAA